MWELKHLTGSTADVYLKYIQQNLPEGVAMEIMTELEQLPEHIKEPIWETVPEEKDDSKSQSFRETSCVDSWNEHGPATQADMGVLLVERIRVPVTALLSPQVLISWQQGMEH